MKTHAFKSAARKVMASALTAAMMLTSAITGVAAAENDRVDQIVEGMSLRDKVTQTLMPDFRKWTLDESTSEAQDFTVMNDQVSKIIADYNFGAVILFANNVKTTEQSFDLVQAMQAAAVSDGGIPLLIATDQEGGSVARLGSGCSLPGNMALGATGDTANAAAAGEIIGSELSSLGINVDLAPVVDVNNNPNNPVIGLRSYGDDPVAVGEMASAEIAALSKYDVIGCAKHFPGHGDTATDSHYGLPSVDKAKDVLMNNELMPYQVAIDSGIEMIMTAHILYPQLDSSTLHSNKTGKEESLPATMSKAILTDLLKGELGFEGVVVTDAMNMEGVAANWDQVQAVINALNAGADLICMPTVLYSQDDLADLDAVIDGVLAAVEDGTLPESRLDDACTRILKLKEKHGILDLDPAAMDKQHALDTVGGAENRAKEREIAAAAVTVVKNDNNMLPLDVKSGQKVLLLTPYDNEPALMAMGFNRAKESGAIPADAQFEYEVYTSQSELSDSAKAKMDDADHIMIVSEISSGARLAGKHWSSAAPLAFAAYAKSIGKPAVVMSVNKPYDLPQYTDAGAVLAVYGDKGSTADPTETLIGGITGTVETFGPNMVAGTEVILGTYGAKGKLPVNIPSYDPEAGVFTEDIVYPRGYGLETVAKKDMPVPISMQPEDSVVNQLNATNTVVALASGPEASYQWFVKNPGDAEFTAGPAVNTYTVLLDPATNGQQAFCRITLPTGATADTNTVTLTNTAIPAKAALDQQLAEPASTEGKTKASAKAYQDALDQAKALADKQDAAADELNAAVEAIKSARENLDDVVSAKTKEDLKNLLASFKEENYTPESWKAFAPVLSDAAKVLADADLGEKQAKNAMDAVNKAAEKLVKKTPSGSDQKTDDKKNKPAASNKKPATGVSDASFSAMLGAAAAAAVLVYNRRRKAKA